MTQLKRKCYITPAFSGVPKQRGQNQKSKPTPGVTMMHHATKRGFKDCPGFLNSTGRLGPKRGRKCRTCCSYWCSLLLQPKGCCEMHYVVGLFKSFCNSASCCVRIAGAGTL